VNKKLEKELTQQQAMKFARQIMLPNFDIDKQWVLQHSSALIIGAGGLGCAAVQYLLASGIGHVTLVDDDKIEMHNLPRQILYSEDDIGQFKAQTAVNFLTHRHPQSEVIGICQRLCESDLSKQIIAHNIVLDCCDNLATRELLNKLCYKLNTALVSGAAIRMEGQLFCVLPKDNSACYQCFSQFFNEQQLSCHQAGIMSPIVGIIGNMQALEAIKILTRYGQILRNTLLMFDGMQSQWVKLKVAKSATCQVCNG
jgi:molybdopterin/thiamine biosynthesis adenylyltransferase